MKKNSVIIPSDNNMIQSQVAPQEEYAPTIRERSLESLKQYRAELKNLARKWEPQSQELGKTWTDTLDLLSEIKMQISRQENNL